MRLLVKEAQTAAMKKIVAQTAEAQRNAANRAKRKSISEFRRAQAERRRETKTALQGVVRDLRAARIRRREDWDLGFMAPLRNIDGQMTHAATEGARMTMTQPLKAWEIEARCAWAGGSQYLNIRVGDRVVVTEGPFKGVIDKINKINMETATVQLADSAKRLMKVPDLYRELDKNINSTSTIPIHLPISAIRLVHPLTDPETGNTRDVIVQSLRRGEVKWHRQSSSRMWTRYITGLNVAVPWPEQEPTVYEDTPADTRRANVEAPTFVPTLLGPPMPAAVLDELRNRYSKFRTRHDQAFVARKVEEEARRLESRRLTAEMLTPIQEFNKQERDIRRARGTPVLSKDMLSRIGEVIARNKAESLANAGLSEEPAAKPTATATTDASTPPPPSS